MSCQAWVASELKVPQFTPPVSFQNILGHKEGMFSWDGDVAVFDFIILHLCMWRHPCCSNIFYSNKAKTQQTVESGMQCCSGLIWPGNLEINELVSEIPFLPNEVKRASFCSLRWRYITHPWNINVSVSRGRWMEAHMHTLIKRSLKPHPALLLKEAWY